MSSVPEAPRCVFCRKHPVEATWRPFCSERCKLLDLAHWADGTYRVAAEPVDPAVAAGEENTDTSEA